MGDEQDMTMSAATELAAALAEIERLRTLLDDAKRRTDGPVIEPVPTTRQRAAARAAESGDPGAVLAYMRLRREGAD